MGHSPDELLVEHNYASDGKSLEIRLGRDQFTVWLDEYAELGSSLVASCCLNLSNNHDFGFNLKELNDDIGCILRLLSEVRQSLLSLCVSILLD